MDYRKLYKENPISKNRTENSKQALFASRRSKRLENFNTNRKNLEHPVEIRDTDANAKKIDRRTLLLQWKDKRNKERRNLDMKKKPFIVGVIHHNIGSPLFKDISNTHKTTSQLTKENVGKTKASSELSPIRQFPFKPSGQTGSKFKFQVQPSLKKLTIPKSPNFLSAKKKLQNEQTTDLLNKETGKSNTQQKENIDNKQRVLRSQKCRVRLDTGAPKTTKPAHKVKSVSERKAPHGNTVDSSNENLVPVRAGRVCLSEVLTADLPEEDGFPICSRIEIASTDMLLNTPVCEEKAVSSSNEEEEFVISPFVTLTRGKQRNSTISRPEDSAKKQCFREMSKRSLSSSHHEAEMEDMSEAAPYYAKLDYETKRIIDKCDDWSTLLLTVHHIPKDIVDEIDSVVGQSRLLVKDKFQQFRSLVNRFESKVEPHVTSDDLAGFWDMMYIQVEKLDERFMKLTSLKENNWIYVDVEKPAKTNGRKITKKVFPENPKKPQVKAKVNFRQFLKAMKNPDTGSSLINARENDVPNDNVPLPMEEAQLTSTENPGTPRKSAASESLLKQVLSNSIKKSVRTSTKGAYNAVRTSLIGKELGTSPVKLVEDPFHPNSPSNRSILKKSPSINSCGIKKKVLFGDTSHYDISDSDVSEALNDTTFTLEDDDDWKEKSSSPADSSAATETNRVERTLLTSVEEHEFQLPTLFPDTAALNRNLVTPKRSQKRTSLTPRTDFTPRRSVRLMEKLRTPLSTPEIPAQNRNFRKKSAGTPHPKKKM